MMPRPPEATSPAYARGVAAAEADVDRAIHELTDLVNELEHHPDVHRRMVERPFALARLDTMTTTRSQP